MLNAESTVEQLFRQTEPRYLKMFAEAVRCANECGRDKWGVSLYPNDRVRLIVGSVVVCTLHVSRIWFALDKDRTKDYAAVANSDDWQETPRDDYIAVASISGYYTPSGSRKHAAMWRKIKKMNCSLIDKAATKYRRLRKPSQKAHSREFMDFLRRELKDPALPDPVY